jgi:hypothetical protein
MGTRLIVECEHCNRTFTSVPDAEEHALDHKDPRDVADYIHRKACYSSHSGHIDDCPYNDEPWDRAGLVKLGYLRRAGKVLDLSRKHGIGLRELLEALT